MRLGILCLGVLAMATAHAQRNKGDDTGATKRACSVEECFFARDIRDFEVVDQTHLIVYTGPQRCAFHIELRGTMCDMTYAPELYFSRNGEMPDSGVTGGGIGPGGGPSRDAATAFGALDAARSNDRHLRICDNDMAIQVHGGRFTESGSNVTTDRFGNPRPDCQVMTVTSITDDQLVEFFVARKVVPPPPPIGTGEIEVGDQDEPPEQGAARDGAPPPEAPKTRGRAR